MRFMVMHKMTAEMEKGLPPELSIIEGVGRLIEEGAKDNVFVSGEGLKPSSQRLHLRYQNGQRTLTQGPFADVKDLVARFALLRVRAREEALAWCDEIAAVFGAQELGTGASSSALVEIFLGPVVEPWDLGMGSKPADAPLRFLATIKADAASEAEVAGSASHMARRQALVEKMSRLGVLEAGGGLASTRRGARVRFAGGKPTVIDGPFAESKELVAGYAILELTSKEAAVAWAVRFGDVVKVEEIDVRLLAEAW